MKASLGLWSEIRHLMMCIHWTMTQTLRDGDEQSVLCYRSLAWFCCCYNLDVMILQFWLDYFCHYIIDLIIFLSLLISSGVIFLSFQFCCRNSFAMVFLVTVLMWFFVITVLMWFFCHYSFDVENGTGGRGGLEGTSPSSRLLLQNPPQRRDSFLYRPDSDYDLSPKSMSRHSSVQSDVWVHFIFILPTVQPLSTFMISKLY